MEGDTDATRLGFVLAETGEGDWLTAAVAYAATAQGRAHLLEDLLPLAIDLGDEQRQANLHAAVLRGERQRAAVDEGTRRATGRTRVADRVELDRYTTDFAVARAQILRDHAISHVLGALADSPAADQLIFYGGTALSRTLLPRLRLSEDIDLIARGDRAEVAEHVERTVTRALRRSHGAASWRPTLSSTRGAQPSLLSLRDGITIKVQLMKAGDLPSWPTEPTTIFQRYSDAPPASLTTFTPAAFVAAKTTAWADRRAARDLYDLWALGHLGLVEAEALDVFRSCGGFGGDPQPWMFRDSPSDTAWHTALSHQGAVRVSPAEALRTVGDMWRRVASQ